MTTPEITQPTTFAGSGGGSGTVTSVDLSLPAFLTVSGNPITTSGTLTAVLATQAANKIFAGPTTGAAAAPTFRSLVAADIPDISATYLPLAGGTLTGALSISANGAASVSPLALTGTILASGTGTTNFPAMFIQPTGTTAATTWSTSGTGLGMNLASGFAGNFLDFHVAGAASTFKIASDGSITTSGSITATSGSLTLQSNGNISFNGRNVLTSPGTAILQLGLADAAAPVAQTLGVQSVVAGTTNTAGADFTIRGSAGTGTGVGGATVFSSAKAGSTGTAQNTFAEAFRILGTGAAVKLSGGGVTVANLPAAVQGGLAFVTDATATAITGLGLAVTGSGANKVVVYSDGTNWLIL